MLPLATRRQIISALCQLQNLRPDLQLKVIRKASALEMISDDTASRLLERCRERLGEGPQVFWCEPCTNAQTITCPWCDSDACARCWTCVTSGCGPDSKAAGYFENPVARIDAGETPASAGSGWQQVGHSQLTITMNGREQVTGPGKMWIRPLS